MKHYNTANNIYMNHKTYKLHLLFRKTSHNHNHEPDSNPKLEVCDTTI